MNDAIVRSRAAAFVAYAASQIEACPSIEFRAYLLDLVALDWGIPGSAPTPIVEVELVAKPVAPPALLPPASAPPPHGAAPVRRKTAPPTQAAAPAAPNGPAPKLADERAALEWVEARMRSAASRHETAPRLDINEMMQMTGWGRSACVKFVSRVLDGKSRQRPAAGIGALIAALNGPEDEDLAEAPDAVMSAADVKKEKDCLYQARSSAKRAGKPWDEHKWRESYRARRRAKSGAGTV